MFFICGKVCRSEVKTVLRYTFFLYAAKEAHRRCMSSADKSSLNAPSDRNEHYSKTNQHTRFKSNVRSGRTKCTRTVRTQIWKCPPAYFTFLLYISQTYSAASSECSLFFFVSSSEAAALSSARSTASKITREVY